jgi:hypothetical protein
MNIPGVSLFVVVFSWLISETSFAITSTATLSDAERCSVFENMPGTEDFDTLPAEDGSTLFLISSDSRRPPQNPTQSKKNGGIFFARWSGRGHALPEPYELPRLNRDEEAFHPHGISSYLFEGKPYVAVVNHMNHPFTHAIEVFQIKENGLLFQKRYLNKRIRSPNDIIALSPHEFYVSNDHLLQTFAQYLEDILNLPTSGISHFRNDKWSHAAGNLRFANGLAASFTQDKFYATATRGKALHVYERNIETGTLTHQKRYPLASMPDNLLWENQTTLNLTGHLEPIAFLQHAFSESNISPWDMSRFHTETGRLETVFSHDGSTFSAGSSALIKDGHLFAGTVFDAKFLTCADWNTGDTQH